MPRLAFEVPVQGCTEQLPRVVDLWRIPVNEGLFCVVGLLKVSLARGVSVEDATHGLDDGLIRHLRDHVVEEEQPPLGALPEALLGEDVRHDVGAVAATLELRLPL